MKVLYHSPSLHSIYAQRTILQGYQNAFMDIHTNNIIDIFNYASTNMYKTTRALGGRDVNGSGGYVDYLSGIWVSTSAITSIKLYHASLTLPQYCTYALYGVKA